MAKRKNKPEGEIWEYLRASNLIMSREEHTTKGMAKKSGLSVSEVNKILSGKVRLGTSLEHLMVKKCLIENEELWQAFMTCKKYREQNKK